MFHAPESQQVLDRFAGEIEDLRTIARLHGLPTGNPERLAGFPLRLSKDVRLRSDLAEMVRSLQQRDADLGMADAVSLVLVAIGGASALRRNQDLEEAVDLTGGFLASLGGWPGSAVEPMIDIDNPPDHDPRLDLAAVASTDTFEADLVATNVPHSEDTVDVAAEMEADPAREPNGAVTLAEITHALARLERGNLELRLHLDSIDQRICRMEPLLESVPHTSGPEGPPLEPTPPSQRSGSAERHPDWLPDRLADQLADRHTDRVNDSTLVHRNTPLSHPPSPALDRATTLEKKTAADLQYEIDRQDALKEQRRISLISNFADPASTTAPSRSPNPVPTPVASAPVNLAGAIADPVSHPRVSQPRRDRFAAARELPGMAADLDPLYNAPDETLAGRVSNPPAAKGIVTEPDRSAVAPVDHVAPAQGSASAEDTEPVYLSLEPQTFAKIVPEQENRSPRVQTPSPWSSVSQLKSREPESRSFASRIDASERVPPPVRSRTPWVAGLTAAAVFGAAGFLYVNGLPSAVSSWMGGSGTAATADIALPQTASSSETSQAQTSDPGNAGNSAAPHPRSKPSITAPAPSGRVLGARESFTPSESVERTSGPTFVPGGIMDGYLISAPRPEYPKLASLVGLQGKMSFEAMISKTGEVEALKLLGGPQGLRDAATDAVKQWQYRPFEVKGRPVEVRTIIRVDVASHAGQSDPQ